MTPLMKFHDLVGIAAHAGIGLIVDKAGLSNLYIFTTPEDYNLYVGRTTSKTAGARARDEARIAGEGYTDRVGVGFSALVTENHAIRRSVWFEPEGFNKQVLLDHIENEGWHGDPIDNLKTRLKRPLTTEDVEQILVRIHVVTGRLTGNSQFAGQWEASVNGYQNVIAVLAADIARGTPALPHLEDLQSQAGMSKDKDLAEEILARS